VASSAPSEHPSSAKGRCLYLEPIEMLSQDRIHALGLHQGDAVGPSNSTYRAPSMACADGLVFERDSAGGLDLRHGLGTHWDTQRRGPFEGVTRCTQKSALTRVHESGRPAGARLAACDGLAGHENDQDQPFGNWWDPPSSRTGLASWLPCSQGGFVAASDEPLLRASRGPADGIALSIDTDQNRSIRSFGGPPRAEPLS
jgi:hypothetical protein